MFAENTTWPRSADGTPIRTDTMPPTLIHWLAQPVLTVFVFLAAAGAVSGLNFYWALLAAFIVLTVFERLWPARLEWKQSWREWGQVAAMFAISALSMTIVELSQLLVPLTPFGQFHQSVASVWPSDWPLSVQVLIVVSGMQFIAYWLHRWQHEIGFMWRAFGHGTHHTYTKLCAINWNTAHPFESVLLVFPAMLVTIVFGLGELAVIAAPVIMLTTACAHANVRLNERVIGLAFTTNSQHMRHHSADIRESQTNYGCAMTLWDRVFGTFEDGNTKALGDPMKGERTLWKRLTKPLQAAG